MCVSCLNDFYLICFFLLCLASKHIKLSLCVFVDQIMQEKFFFPQFFISKSNTSIQGSCHSFSLLVVVVYTKTNTLTLWHFWFDVLPKEKFHDCSYGTRKFFLWIQWWSHVKKEHFTFVGNNLLYRFLLLLLLTINNELYFGVMMMITSLYDDDDDDSDSWLTVILFF